MIRLLIDKLGTGHKDLFLQIDTLPNHSKTFDSFYLDSFLNIPESNSLQEKNANLPYGVKCLVEYWLENIEKSSVGETLYLPIDISDEYIGCLKMINTKLGFKTKFVFTKDIHGYASDKVSFENQKYKVEFEDDSTIEWLISYDSIIEGLKWSQKELDKI